jgi:hypothetical protein
VTQDPSQTAPEPSPAGEGEAEADRRAGDDRRHGERRRKQVPVSVDRRTGEERRRQTDRRRSINQYDLGAEELEFIHAINRFKERTGKPFPTWSEVLRILHELGYEKRA